MMEDTQRHSGNDNYWNHGPERKVASWKAPHTNNHNIGGYLLISLLGTSTACCILMLPYLGNQSTPWHCSITRHASFTKCSLGCKTQRSTLCSAKANNLLTSRSPNLCVTCLTFSWVHKSYKLLFLCELSIMQRVLRQLLNLSSSWWGLHGRLQASGAFLLQHTSSPFRQQMQ
jgi:hypothetical protein